MINTKIREIMAVKLSQKDKRALKLGAVCVAAVLVLMFAAKWLGSWAAVRKSLAVAKTELKSINMDEAKQAGLLSIVPVFEMPQNEEKQKFLFRDKLNEQLKKVGIRSEPLQVLSTGKSQGWAGYKLLRLQCSVKCRFEQVLDLLASLNENPYLVGIEEMRIKCNPKNRQEIELNLTVSTFIK